MALPDDDRRPGAGFAWDPETHTMRVGDLTCTVDVPLDNDKVLRAYLRLVAEARETRTATHGGLRDDDLEALARILDLTDHNLDLTLSQLLGVSVGTALRIRVRLRARAQRLAIAGAAMGLGVAAWSGGTAAASSSPAAAGSRPAAPVEASPRSHVGGTEQVERLADGSLAIVRTSNPAPGRNDGTDIGGAETVERIPPASS